MSLLVTPEELSRELAVSQTPLLIDLRPAENFCENHLPGAVHLDLFGISSVDTDPAPLKAFFWIIEHLLASRGVSNDVAGRRLRRHVRHSSGAGLLVPRILRPPEHARARRRLSTPGRDEGCRSRRRRTSRCRPNGPARATRRFSPAGATCSDRLGSPDAVILDTRSDGEYCGTNVRAARGGAVPGAVHLEWTNNLGPDGAFKPLSELRQMYERAGVTPDREVVTYCQGGYRAAHSYLALRLLGYPRVRNYIGSWKEWGDRVDLPIEHPKEP